MTVKSREKSSNWLESNYQKLETIVCLLLIILMTTLSVYISNNGLSFERSNMLFAYRWVVGLIFLGSFFALPAYAPKTRLGFGFRVFLWTLIGLLHVLQVALKVQIGEDPFTALLYGGFDVLIAIILSQVFKILGAYIYGKLA